MTKRKPRKERDPRKPICVQCGSIVPEWQRPAQPFPIHCDDCTRKAIQA